MKILATINWLIVGLIAVSLTQQGLLALSQREVEEIAKQTTVKIIGHKPGTGAIVQKQKDTSKGRQGYLYTVLTNCHVLLLDSNDRKFCNQENKLTSQGMLNSTGYRVETSDRQQYISEISSVKIHPNADLAILKFFSTIEYETVRIGNAEQLSGSSKVYVFGWAVPSKTSRDRRARFLGPGNILGIDRKAAGGYQIAHKLELVQGMSGGPLLHENGCLVGINGGGDRDPNTQVIEFLSVPINLYASWQNIQVVDDCRATPLPDNNRFQTLRSLLEQGNWQRAEAETKKLMLRGTDQTYFNGNIINNLSCSDLKIINRLWVQYSSGHFGFSVQGEIWKGVKNDYKQFEERVGWRRGYEGPLTNPPNYSLEAKKGHLPSYKLLAASDFGTFLNRLEKCDALSFTDSGIIENIISSESEP
ncbi:GUN4 domain-containing protein [Microcystis sp.]|uniref:GUN4 domain-containing protein n=1 Tax=Microcystis sp. TaxID=1127 RepID=UPI003AF7EAF8